MNTVDDANYAADKLSPYEAVVVFNRGYVSVLFLEGGSVNSAHINNAANRVDGSMTFRDCPGGRFLTVTRTGGRVLEYRSTSCCGMCDDQFVEALRRQLEE